MWISQSRNKVGIVKETKQIVNKAEGFKWRKLKNEKESS